nr:immunoglobulin heavy chain junction region [Mus musculus]
CARLLRYNYALDYW